MFRSTYLNHLSKPQTIENTNQRKVVVESVIRGGLLVVRSRDHVWTLPRTAYAHIEIVVAFLVVKIFSLLIMAS